MRTGILNSLLALAVAGAAFTQSAAAQEFPSRPVRIIVPNAPGAAVDILARIIGPDFGKNLGQPVIVENKAGANAMIGYEYVAKQVPADGYTIIFSSVANLAGFPGTVKELRFDPVKDLPPIAGVAEQRLILVTATDRPWNSVADLAAYGRANPGKLNYGYPSVFARILLEGIVGEFKIDAQGVPYSSAGPFYTAVMAGEVQMGLVGPANIESFGDKVKLIAATGVGRHPAYPQTPSFQELGGKKSVMSSGFSLNAPAGVPKAAFDRLYAAAAKTLQQPDITAQIVKLHYEITLQNPDVAAKSLADQTAALTELAKQIGIEPQ